MMSGKAPQSFLEVVCQSVDRSDMPTLSRRLFPLLLILAQLINVLIVGVGLLGLGWLALVIFGSQTARLDYIYLTGATAALMLAIPFTGLQMLLVLFRNFIYPQ